MSLSPGTRLGAYEVVSLLGAGGMGEVYRARDTRLGRAVALKVLPDAFVHDPERLARFAREAQLLAALNHPNIAQVYGFDDGALSLELVEGPTLADRIAAGGLPVDDALAIARQIVDALEAGHAQGIVHRDLKPANIKVREDGTVKVLDFGLAKLADNAAGSSAVLQSLSPTLTSPVMATGVGTILGTAAYMAPEQARGKAVDRRADVWAFGCVLYEMLTGRRAFEDEDVSLTLSRILQRDPEFSHLPVSTPLNIRRVLELCLRKDPRRRLADMQDVRLLLQDDLGAPPTAPAIAPRPDSGAQRVAVAAGAIALMLVAAAAAWWLKPTPTAAREVFVQSFPVAETSRAQASTQGGVAPRWRKDGRELFYRSTTTGGRSSLMSVTVEPTLTSLRLGSPKPLFPLSFPQQGHATPYTSYAPTEDGQKFLVIRENGGSQNAPGEIAVVVNWDRVFEGVKP